MNKKFKKRTKLVEKSFKTAYNLVEKTMGKKATRQLPDLVVQLFFQVLAKVS